MTISILLLWLGLQSTQQLQQQLQLQLQLQAQLQQHMDQQNRQIERLQQEVQKLSTDLQKTHTLLQNELKNGCDAQVQWLTVNPRITNVLEPLKANLFSVVSAGDCFPTEIRITATYFDPTDTFLCSGSVTISQYARTQNLALELRPYEIEVFTRWWDGATLKQQGLTCYDYQGIENRLPSDAATSLRLYATASPKRGGLATSEIHFSLPRLQRQ